ncbi:hypothetical protein AC062_1293 [Pasteurellaceae bacterium NI1060]|nr:hypothetical protein AC062_1293 [Pasteurellaceae bacterium NI1060]
MINSGTDFILSVKMRSNLTALFPLFCQRFPQMPFFFL